MTAVCETLDVARSNIARRVVQGPSRRRGRPALSKEPLLTEIMAVIAEMPSYVYPRVWAVLRRRSEAQGDAPANRKRVYRTMKKHGLLLQNTQGAKLNVSMMAASRSGNPMSAGAPMISKSSATMQSAFVSLLLSTAATEGP